MFIAFYLAVLSRSMDSFIYQMICSHFCIFIYNLLPSFCHPSPSARQQTGSHGIKDSRYYHTSAQVAKLLYMTEINEYTQLQHFPFARNKSIQQTPTKESRPEVEAQAARAATFLAAANRKATTKTSWEERIHPRAHISQPPQRLKTRDTIRPVLTLWRQQN